MFAGLQLLYACVQDVVGVGLHVNILTLNEGGRAELDSQNPLQAIAETTSWSPGLMLPAASAFWKSLKSGVPLRYSRCFWVPNKAAGIFGNPLLGGLGPRATFQVDLEPHTFTP